MKTSVVSEESLSKVAFTKKLLLPGSTPKISSSADESSFALFIKL